VGSTNGVCLRSRIPRILTFVALNIFCVPCNEVMCNSLYSPVRSPSVTTLVNWNDWWSMRATRLLSSSCSLSRDRECCSLLWGVVRPCFLDLHFMTMVGGGIASPTLFVCAIVVLWIGASQRPSDKGLSLPVSSRGYGRHRARAMRRTPTPRFFITDFPGC
jgi:hypothetical protein